MAKRANATIPQPKVEVLRIQDLSAGVDLRRSPSLMKPNRARALRNFSLEEPGALKVFPGFKVFSTTNLGVGRPQGGQRIYLRGSLFTLVAHGGSVFKPTDAGVWGSAVLTGLSSTEEIFFPYDQDLVAVMDGVNVPKKSTDGTTWTQLGISAPSTAPTLAGVSGGDLLDANQYEVSYTYKDDALAHQGNDSPVATHTVATPNKIIRCTIPRSTDPQVDTIVVYVRNKTTGQTVRRKVGTVANPGAGDATFDIDGPDADWDGADEVPTDHNVAPATLEFAVPWKNRWWAKAGKNRIRFTQLFQNQSWGALFFIDLPFTRGDEIAAFIPSGDTLVVFGFSGQVFLINGRTSLDFEVVPAAAAEAGAVGPRAVEALEHGILHGAAEGLYLFDGASDRFLSYDIDVAWKDIIANAATADIEKIAVEYHKARKEVRITVPRLFPLGTFGEWVLDLNRTRLQEEPAWTSTTRTIGGYIHWDGKETVQGNRGRLFSWSNTDGKLFEEATGTDADGADMVAEYEGPTLSRGFLVSHFYELLGEYEPNSGTFAIETLVDGVSQGTQNIDIGGGLALYGSAQYGVSTYAGGNRKMFNKTLPLGAEGRALTVKAKYTGKAAFKWFTYGTSVIDEPAIRGIGL